MGAVPGRAAPYTRVVTDTATAMQFAPLSPGCHGVFPVSNFRSLYKQFLSCEYEAASDRMRSCVAGSVILPGIW